MPGRTAAFAILTLALAAAPAAARADLLRATRPGVMCTSPDALAKLTLPDGSSRSAGNASPAFQAIADAGGCRDFGVGRTVILLTARRNTDIVRGDTMTGDGVLGDFIVPGIDFAPYTPPHGPFNDTSRARCPASPDKLTVLGPTTYTFVASLPKQTQAEINHEADVECGDPTTGACLIEARTTAIEKRHLEQRWAEFLCRNPEPDAH